MAKEGKANAQGSSKAQPLRVAQHESVHTINAILQQSAFTSINSILKGDLPPSSARKGCQYLQSLARKATLRLDVSIKHSICKRCHSFLLPGLNCTIRLRPSKPSDLVLVRRCTTCGASRKMPCPAVQSKRFKALARRHEKRQAKIDNRKVSKKVEAVTQGAIKVDEKGVLCTANAKHGKLSQRARRRAARMIKREANEFPKADRRARKRKRRKCPQKSSAVDDKGSSNIHQPTEPEVSTVLHSSSKVGSQKTPKMPSKKGRARKMDLPPYHERLQSTSSSETNWKHDLPKDTSVAERQALSMLRGDHVVTVGLGKGGVVGDTL